MRPCVSVIMPVYNVEKFVAYAVTSVLQQSYSDLELIIVDDGGQDESMAICRRLADHRTRVVQQANLGLAGARNSGIALARGEFVALIDSDDAMLPDKLARHVAHLRTRPDVGVSYAGAELIDEQNMSLGIFQQPQLGRVTAADVFCGKVILNGSIPVFRRETLEDVSFVLPGQTRRMYFDETLRRSEDVEFWTRVALTTDWRFAGLPGRFTQYRISHDGLSADVVRQLASWDAACLRIARHAPEFIARFGQEARALELRYLARRCFQLKDRQLAWQLALQAIATAPWLLAKEPTKTLTTLLACMFLRALPVHHMESLMRFAKPSLA